MAKLSVTLCVTFRSLSHYLVHKNIILVLEGANLILKASLLEMHKKVWEVFLINK